MDKEKISELKGWLREAKLNDCNEYIVIAINKKHRMVGSAEASFENMLEMIVSFAEQNQPFKEVLLATVSYFIQKDAKSKEEGGRQ
ncbi:MAG: hypothetical protein IJ057_06280 [Bacteroidales bacterium]|nr:hypothetical protein [Bacteroidales bacterium]